MPQLTISAVSNISTEIERQLQHDHPEEAARTSQGISAANMVVESWALQSHGKIISQDGASFTIEIPAAYLEELAEIIERIEGVSGSEYAVGVGADAGEAIVARRVAEQRGGSRNIVLYTPDIHSEIEDDIKDSESDIFDGEMNKAEEQRRPGEATQVVRGEVSPLHTQPSPPPSPSISADPHAPPSGDRQSAPEPSEQDLVGAIGQVLSQFKQQVPFFEQQVKSANRPAYDAVMGLVQGLIALAQQLVGNPATNEDVGEAVQKAEDDMRRSTGRRNHRCSRCGNLVSVLKDGRVEAHLHRQLRSSTLSPCDGEAALPVKKSETSKVEIDPSKPLPDSDALRKLFDWARDSIMQRGEEDWGADLFREFPTGFEHERSEHPHLDDHDTALTTIQHLKEDPNYYTKIQHMEESGVLGKEEVGRHRVVLPVGSRGVGAKGNSIKVLEPTTGKTAWHQMGAGCKLSADGHPISTKVTECGSADTPEHRAAAAGLVGR